MAQKEKEKKEEKLRELARMARDKRAGIKRDGDKGTSGSRWRVLYCIVPIVSWFRSVSAGLSRCLPPRW